MRYTTFPILHKKEVAGTTLKTGLISVWEMQETTGSTAFDSFGSNDGAISGVDIAQYGFGNLTYSYYYNSDDYVNTPFNGSEYDQLTLSVWFKTDSLSTGGSYKYILDNSPVSAGYIVRQQNNTITAYSYRSTGTYNNSVTIPSTGWNMLLVEITRTSILSSINTVANTPTSYSDSDFLLSTDTLVIGAEVYFNNNWDGNIVQVSAWNRTLNSTEKALLYNSGNGLLFASW